MRSRSEATRFSILRAAHQLFLGKGYASTSVDAIATKAATTKRTIYGYFADKRSILMGVVERAVGEAHEIDTSTLLTATAAGLYVVLLSIAEGLNEIVSQPDYIELLRVTIAEVIKQPDLEVLFEQGITRRSLLSCIEAFTIAKRRGFIPETCDPEMLSKQFVGGLVLSEFLDGLLRHQKGHVQKLTNEQLEDYVRTNNSYIVRNST